MTLHLPKSTHVAKKHRSRKLTRGFYEIVRQKTTGLTDPHMQIEQKFSELAQLLDKKLQHDFHVPLVELPNELQHVEPWTRDWLSFHLNLLTQFGSVLLKQSIPNSYRWWFDAFVPVTCPWDGYLDENLLNSCHPGLEIPEFVWDMYAILKKPTVCKLVNCSGSHLKMSSFLISVPPPLIHSKVSNQSPDDSANHRFQSELDPYEFVRFKLDAKSSGSQHDYISSYQTVQLFGTKFLPQLLDSLVNPIRVSPTDANFKLVEWVRVPGANWDQSEFKVTFDLSDPLKSSHISPATSRSRVSRAPSKTFIPLHEKSSSFYLNSDPSAHSIHTRPGTHHSQTHQPHNLITIRIRFLPVYSLQSILGRGLLTNDYIMGDRSAHTKHLFLRPTNHDIEPVPDQLQHGHVHAWQLCSRLSDACLLDKIDLVDRGCRRQAARILMFFSQIQDSIKPCGLTRVVNHRTVIQLCFQRLHQETNQTCQNQFDYLFKAKSKPLGWPRSRLVRCVRGLMEQLYNSLGSGCLIPFNSIESNLIPCLTRVDQWHLKASHQTVGAWLHSDLTFEIILNLALDKLKALDLNWTSSNSGTYLPSIVDKHISAVK